MFKEQVSWDNKQTPYLLLWSLPLITLCFSLVGSLYRIGSNIHAVSLFKAATLIIWFTITCHYFLKRSPNFGTASIKSFLFLIFFGMGPQWLTPLFWIIPGYFFYQDIFPNLNKGLLKYKKQILFTVGLLAAAFVPYFFTEYSSPRNLGRLSQSHLHIDVLYHASIASMLKIYQTISHGLHGLSGLEYHFGSHVLMACAARLLSIPAFEAYNYFFVFFGPNLLGISLIALTEEILPSKSFFHFVMKLLFYIFLIPGIGIFYGDNWMRRFANWTNFFGSESYNISLILFISLLSILFSKNKSENLIIKAVFIAISVGFMTLTKISTGFCGLAFVGSWALLTRNTLFSKEKLKYWAVFAFAATIFALLFFLINPSMGDAKLDPFQFIRAYVEIKQPLWIRTTLFLLFHFLFTWISFFFYLKSPKKSALKECIPWWWLLGSIICLGVGMGVVLLLYVQGGSGAYFSDVSKFAALPVLMLIPSLYFYNNDNHDWKSVFTEGKVKKVIAIFLCFVFLLYAPRTIVKGIKYFMISIHSKPAHTTLQTYIDHLTSIRNNPDTKKSLVYIPRSEKYWKSMDCRGLGYLIAGISERPGLYAWPSNECYPFLCGPRFHSDGLCLKSQQEYSQDELLKEAKKLGFEGVEIVREQGIKTLK